MVNMFLKYKPIGITLNEQINELKVENCNKICYAGRLVLWPMV